jgi:hypothetical protein
MNTSTITHTLPCPALPNAECGVAVFASRIGITLFAVAVIALESWLRFPIQPLLDGYLQSFMSRLASVAASVFPARSF